MALSRAGARWSIRTGNAPPDIVGVPIAFAPPEVYRRIEAAVAHLPPDDQSLAAWRQRTSIMSQREWIAANAQRGRLRDQWRALFKEWDVVLCSPASTPAFPHDHRPDNERLIDVDGKTYPYRDQSV